MMKKSIYLNDAENLTVELLAKGERMKSIREKSGIPSNRFSFFLAELRRKTGIEDTQNVEECAKYWAEVQKLPEEAGITVEESRLLWGMLEGKSITYTASMMGITEAEGRALLSTSLRKCGIFAKDDRTMRIQTRFFFAIKGIPHSKLPALSPTHWTILRVLAEGGRTEHVQDLFQPKKKAKVANEMIHDALTRIGANSTGRGTRRNIIRAFLDATSKREKEAHHPSHKPSCLDKLQITAEHYNAFFQRNLGTSLEGLSADIGCSLEEAAEVGMKMCKRRPGCDCSEAAILASCPEVAPLDARKEEIAPVTMDDPAF